MTEALNQCREGGCRGHCEAQLQLSTGPLAPCCPSHPAVWVLAGLPQPPCHRVHGGVTAESPRPGRTIVSCQEGGLVHVVFDIEGLAVEDGCRADLTVGGVDVEPVCRV